MDKELNTQMFYYQFRQHKGRNVFSAQQITSNNGEILKHLKPPVSHKDNHPLNHQEDDECPRAFDIGQKILLVEDNRVNQMLVKGMLESLSIQVELANDGVEALKRLSLKDENYQLVFMDCQMPAMNGYQASLRIRAGDAGVKNVTIPIIALTAKTQPKDRENCLTSGMNDYLTKPVTLEAIKAKLQLWLTQQAGDQQPSMTLANAPWCIWDEQAALDRAVGNANLLYSLIKVYLVEIPEHIDSLGQGINDKNFTQIQSMAHTIKGMAANISADSLSHWAAQLEDANRSGNQTFIKSVYGRLYHAHEAVIIVLEAFVERTRLTTKTQSQPSDRENASFIPRLQQIKMKINQSLFIDLDELNNLNGMIQGSKLQILFEQLTHQLSLLEQDRALRTLEKLECMYNKSLDDNCNKGIVPHS